MMYWSQIGQCCGTMSLYGFGTTKVGDRYVPKDWDRKQFRRLIKNQHRTRGLLMTAILKPRQRAGWNTLLTEEGFTISHTWRNHNTGCLLTMYTKISGQANEQKSFEKSNEDIVEAKILKRYSNDLVGKFD